MVLWGGSRQSAHQIFLFVAAACTSFCHSPHTHCRQTISTIFYSVYSAPAPWHRLQQCASYLCGAAASRRAQPLVLIRTFCSFSVWAAHELTTDNPELKWIRKGLQRSWITGHMARSLVIRGFSLCPCASGGFDFLFDSSRGARLICRGSVAGDGGGAGVTPEWQQVKSLISKIRSALLCLTSNKLGLTIKAH